MPSPYLRSKSVQVSKKASIYAAFHCCRGVQVCPVLVRFPLFLYTCTTMKTPVFMRVCAIVVHFLIPSPGATASAPAPGAIAYGACAPLAAFFHRLRRLRPWSSAPHLAAFEKAGKTFPCLHPTCVEGPALAERKKAACPVRPRTQARAFQPAALRKPRRLKAPFATRPAGSPACNLGEGMLQ